MTHRILLVLPLLFACADATPPDRPEPYQYTIPLPSGFQIVFHWTPASLPVRVWADGQSLFHPAADAIRLWEGVALYGEFRGILVQDSTRADVIIRRGEPQNLRPNGSATERLDCAATTTIGVELDTTITLPFRITIAPRAGASEEGVARCFDVVTASELGHTLGLFLHSDDPDDLMYVSPTSGGASVRDRTTFATLYHSPPTVRVPPAR